MEAVKIAESNILFEQPWWRALDSSDVDNKNQVFRVELGDVGSLTEGQFLELVHVCFPTSSRMNLL